MLFSFVYSFMILTIYLSLDNKSFVSMHVSWGLHEKVTVKYPTPTPTLFGKVMLNKVYGKWNVVSRTSCTGRDTTKNIWKPVLDKKKAASVFAFMISL